MKKLGSRYVQILFYFISLSVYSTNFVNFFGKNLSNSHSKNLKKKKNLSQIKEWIKQVSLYVGCEKH
jgi:hypothetical protein